MAGWVVRHPKMPAEDLSHLITGACLLWMTIFQQLPTTAADEGGRGWSHSKGALSWPQLLVQLLPWSFSGMLPPPFGTLWWVVVFGR